MRVPATSYLAHKTRTVGPDQAGETHPRRLLDFRTADARRRVLEVLLDPACDGLSEEERAGKAGMAGRTWRRWRTPDLIDEAIVARRATYSRHILPIDSAMINMAKKGSLPHAELFYERTEGYMRKAPKAAADMQIEKEVWDVVGTEYREQLANTLAQALRTRHERASTHVNSVPGAPSDTKNSAHIPPPLPEGS